MFVGNVWLSIIHRFLRRHYASGKLLFTQNFTIMNNNQNENNDNVKSIHDFDFNIICEYFSWLSSYLVWVGVKFSNAKEEELLINDASQIGSKKFDFSIE